MAKIAEAVMAVKVSKLVKDSDGDDLDVFSEEITEQLQEVLETLLGDGYVVELES